MLNNSIKAEMDIIGILHEKYNTSPHFILTVQPLRNIIYQPVFLQVQWTDLIISKTRMVSIFTQKMSNWILNSAIVFETVLAIILIYTPVVPQYVGLYPLNPTWWIPALPFSLLILVIDETRRYIMRSSPSPLQRFIIKETYY